MKRITIIFAIALLMISTSVFAQRTTDIKGSKDYPMISRFEGSIIQYYKEFKWQDYQVPLSKMVTTEERGRYFEKSKKLEGKVVRTQYTASPDNNPSYVYKNYEAAFENAGFEILFQGKGDEGLGDEPADFCRTFYGDIVRKFGFAYNPQGQNHAMIVAKTNKDKRDIYAVIYISGFSDVTLITQDVIETEAAKTGKVTAQNINEDISANGHIAIYDIHFDTGKSEIKSGASVALRNIAEYLQAHTSQKFLIVGHTDNVGNFDTNIKLSKERAKAVMNELITKYNVKPEQLKACGDGSTAPVASNSTDDGKAKNRRVEIVEQ